MLLSLYYHSPILPPKTLKDPPFLSPFLSTRKTLSLQNPSKPSKTLIQCYATQTPQPHSQFQSQTPMGNRNQSLPRSPIQRIAEKLRNLGIVEEKDKTLNPEPKTGEKDSAGEIFIPLPGRIPKYRVGHTIDTSWSTPDNPVPEPGSGGVMVRYNEMRNEVRKQKRLEGRTKENKEVPSLAELKLSKRELRRLTTVGIGLKQKLKVGKAGITEGIVNGIHERWRNAEVVKIVCEDLCRMNMKRTHDLLEMKTGGLVVWRSGSKIILYRGTDYKYPYFLSDQSSMDDASPDALPNQLKDSEELDKMNGSSSGMDGVKPPVPSPTNKKAQPTLIHGVGSPDKVRFQLPGEAALVEEADRLLDGLGPRFTDWWGYDPQPVDADLLPAVVPGYRRPFRLLPYGVQPKLTNDEMTTLRRLGRPLPCHFALGRNRKLQGLAAAIVKLWEKCEIAKVAVKRGVQNTNSELMAEELKWLTGGTLLARDREFIVLYRGKDFLPSAVSSAIEERRKHGIFSEKQRIEFNTSSAAEEELKLGNIQCNSGDNIESKSDDKFNGANNQKSILSLEQKKLRLAEAAIRRTSIKLSMALEKKTKAEELLAELEKKEIPQQPELDKEGITEEERYMLKKVGLRMKAFLLMGRRGVFDGTVENMHLHWKYRELVKIITKQRSIEAAHQEAEILEAESGGILVAVERVSKGYAIIMYRGKNYERPACLRPKTLLTKRQAMKRSLEAQRRESLKLHVLELAKNIDKLKHQLVKDEEAKANQSVDKSILPLIKEERSNMESAKCVASDSELESGHGSHSVIPTTSEMNVEAREEHGADSPSTKSNEWMDATIDSPDVIKQDNPDDLSSTYSETKISKSEFESSSESVRTEIQASAIVHLPGEGRAGDSVLCPNNFVAGEEHGADSPSTKSNEWMDATIDSPDVIKQDNPDELSSTYSETKISKSEFESSSESVSTEIQASAIVHLLGEGRAGDSVLCPDNFVKKERGYSAVHVENCSYKNEPIGSSVKTAKERPEPAQMVIENGSNKMASRPVNLSNRDRLLLRKQALSMKKRPVIAVGRSNMVTGVAKTIKSHFERHPLAIVNVKGRAKGTSVQEVVSKLQEATGAVLVSQEPSKVILYRGWGAEDDSGRSGKRKKGGKTLAGTEIVPPSRPPAVSPELLAAIRLECGLQGHQEQEAVS